MVRGNARRPGVEIEVFVVVEAADLLLAKLVDDIAVAEGEVTAAGAMGGF